MPISPGNNRVHVDAFRIDRKPVTNGEFASFVRAHPEWQKGRVPALYADRQYLAQWVGAGTPGAGAESHPVTRVSWFAASAYCEARSARLPTWYEWEFVAAASETQRDARKDPQWRQQILDWYAAPGGRSVSVGSRPANIYGVRDMHGLIWEWVEDFNGMLVSADNREQGDGNIARFCGTGALSMEQKEQYAILMRIAMPRAYRLTTLLRISGFAARRANESILLLFAALLLAMPGAARAGESSASLYNLKVELTDQTGVKRSLDLDRGHPVLIAMFYGGCQAVCPLIFEGVHATEAALPAATRADVRVIMVSIDPVHDTPEVLAHLARKRRADLTPWTLVRANEHDVRLLAAALNVQYRRLPNGDYNHTSIITYLSSDGSIVKQTSVLTHADPELVAALSGKK